MTCAENHFARFLSKRPETAVVYSSICIYHGTSYSNTICASIVSQIHLSLYVLEIWKIDTRPSRHVMTKRLLVPWTIRPKVQCITGPEVFASMYTEICGKHVLTTVSSCFSDYSMFRVLPMAVACKYSTHIHLKIFSWYQYQQYNIWLYVFSRFVMIPEC